MRRCSAALGGKRNRSSDGLLMRFPSPVSMRAGQSGLTARTKCWSTPCRKTSALTSACPFACGYANGRPKNASARFSVLGQRPGRSTAADGGSRPTLCRIETEGRAYATAGTPLALHQWHHIVAVKSGRKLTLYLDGVQRASADVPAVMTTISRFFALGGNPAYSGPEFLAADFADLLVRNRALSDTEATTVSHP